jgi:hypothetical protein
LLLRSNRFQLLLLGAVLFGVYCFVLGQSGLFERMRLEKERGLLAREIAFLESENVRARDLRDRYVRGEFTQKECEDSGYIIPGDRKLFFSGGSVHEKKAGNAKESAEGVSIERLRIGWIVFSALVVGIFLVIRRRALFRTFNSVTQRGIPDEN